MYSCSLDQCLLYLTFSPFERADGTERSHHSSSVLQRFPASGDERRRHHFRNERSTNHQRTDGCSHRLRTRQEGTLELVHA